MSFRKHFEKLEGQFNRVMDSIERPKQSSTPPQVPYGARPGHQPPLPPRPGQYPGQYGQQSQGQYWNQQQHQSYQQPQGHQQQYGAYYPPQPPAPYGQYNPPAPYGASGPSTPSAPSQPHAPYGGSEQPPSVPTSSKPGSGPAPIPFSSKPNASTPAPPPYSQHDSSAYWNPTFSPDVPVSQYFDYDLGAGGWGNDELQTYTSYPPNAFHTPDQKLVIRCIIASNHAADRDKYTSARLLSKQRLARRRGYISAVLSAPCAKGIWPAFWLLPEEPFEWPQDGEVDIFEAWNGSSENHSCLHWGNYTDRQDKQKHRVINTHINGVSTPHEYGFAWEQGDGGAEGGRLIWYIDGRAIMSASRPPGTRRLESWRILLNIAVGGTVCDGCVPSDGTYDMVVSRLSMSDVPPGGWERFEQDWLAAPDGRSLE